MLSHITSLVPSRFECLRRQKKKQRGHWAGRPGYARGTEHFHYFIDALCPSSPSTVLYQGFRRVIALFGDACLTTVVASGGSLYDP
jgi:hypothetical protein